MDKIYKKTDEQILQMASFYKSIVDQDRSSVVICNLKHEIIYMNPVAVQRYAKRGGAELIGKSLLSCHNAKSNELIQRVIDWFRESPEHNIIFTTHNIIILQITQIPYIRSICLINIQHR